MIVSNKQERMWKELVMTQAPSFSVCETDFNLIWVSRLSSGSVNK